MGKNKNSTSGQGTIINNFPSSVQEMFSRFFPMSGAVPAVQSDFFKKSILHTENIIKGIIPVDDYLKEEKNGSDVVRTFAMFSPSEKNSLLSMLNYYQSDPILYSASEKQFRTISAAENLPLWIIILREAMKKLHPDIVFYSDKKIHPDLE